MPLRWKPTFPVLLPKLQQEQMEDQLNDIRDWLKQYVIKAQEQNIPVQSRCAIGHPGPKIRDFAQEWGADLIILGRPWFGRFVRSIARQREQLCLAPCQLFGIGSAGRLLASSSGLRRRLSLLTAGGD